MSSFRVPRIHSRCSRRRSADRILTGEAVGPDGRQGLHDLQTIRAIHEAAERGEKVGIPLDGE